MTEKRKSSKKLLKPQDIVDKVKTNGNAKLSRMKKAEIILDKIQEGKSYRKIAKEKNLALNTPLNIIKSNKELVRHIETNNLDLKENIQGKYIQLLNTKANQLENNEQKLDRTRATELSQVVKDLDGIIRLDKGQATSISATLSQDEAKTELIRSLKVIKDGDLLELTERVFKDDPHPTQV